MHPSNSHFVLRMRGQPCLGLAELWPCRFGKALGCAVLAPACVSFNLKLEMF